MFHEFVPRFTLNSSTWVKRADEGMIYARVSIDPVRQSVTSATSAMLTAAGVKKTAEVTPIKRCTRQASAAR